jgi:HEAT repeat protein
MTALSLDTLPKQLRSLKDVRLRFAQACDCAPRMAAKALLELLRFRHGEARFAAVRELARRRQNGAVPHLLALVLREQYLPALWALGEIADERALPVLDNLLEHGGAGDIAQDSPWHGTLIRALAQYGEAALPILEKSLASKEHPATSLAIRALGLIGSEASRRMLEQEHAKACAGGGPCWEIDNALGRPSNRRTPEKLAKERLLRAAHVVVGKYETVPLADPIQALVETLNHPDGARRRAAVDLLVEFGSRDRSADIGRLAKDPEWEVRASVAYALRQFDVSPEVLATLAKDRNPAVRWLAKKRIIPCAT